VQGDQIAKTFENWDYLPQRLTPKHRAQGLTDCSSAETSASSDRTRKTNEIFFSLINPTTPS